MLDKNPQSTEQDILYKFSQDIPSVILCDESFSKMAFLNYVINSSRESIIFVDMDLLYSGYIRSGMIKEQPSVSIVCPNIEDWKTRFADIVKRVTSKRTLVIVDSLNGLYASLDDLDAARLVNACIMMLSVVGVGSGSSIMVTGIARKREKEWVLSPGGRQLIRSDRTNMYYIRRDDNQLIVSEIDDDGSFTAWSSTINLQTAL